jgi:NAD kinase
VTLAPRVVIVTRRTEYDELLLRHGTRNQAAFFLESRGRDLSEVDRRHRAQHEAVAAATAGIPLDWRRGAVERADLDRFLFAPDDVILVVGQDGLVANVAKYLEGQPVLGINPEPDRNVGVLVRHRADRVPKLLRRAVARDDPHGLTMVELTSDDGQSLTALNEIYVGHARHQTARYTLSDGDGKPERQASSGVLIGTGTGCTGWCRSAWQERQSTLPLPDPRERKLVWFVREAWPSPTTGTSLTEGRLLPDQRLTLVMESDTLVAFGDGIERDAIQLRWGQALTVGVSPKRLRLM